MSVFLSTCAMLPHKSSNRWCVCVHGGWYAELPNKVYENLPAIFGDEFLTSTLVSEQTSTDGTTTKLLLELQDGLRVEVRDDLGMCVWHSHTMRPTQRHISYRSKWVVATSWPVKDFACPKVYLICVCMYGYPWKMKQIRWQSCGFVLLEHL